MYICSIYICLARTSRDIGTVDWRPLLLLMTFSVKNKEQEQTEQTKQLLQLQTMWPWMAWNVVAIQHITAYFLVDFDYPFLFLKQYCSAHFKKLQILYFLSTRNIYFFGECSPHFSCTCLVENGVPSCPEPPRIHASHIPLGLKKI